MRGKLPLPDGWLIARLNNGRYVVLKQWTGWDYYRVPRETPFATRYHAITWIYRVLAKEKATNE